MLRHLFIIYIFNNKVFTGYIRSMYKYLDRFLLTSKCKEHTVCQRKLVSRGVYYENRIRLLGHTVHTSDTYCIQCPKLLNGFYHIYRGKIRKAVKIFTAFRNFN